MAFTAFSLGFKVRRAWILVLFAVTYLTCVSSGTYAQSPTLNLPKPEINLGIRHGGAEFPMKSVYCVAFEEALRREIEPYNIPIVRRDIENDHKGKEQPRYYGIIEGKIDIECGPNSILSGEIEYKKNIPYKNEVGFSNAFHRTNIKLLLKKEWADKLSKSSEVERNNLLKTLKIGYISNTTTELQFQREKNIYPLAEAVIVDGTGNAREKALRQLQADEFDALANNGVLVKSWLERLDKKQDYTLFPLNPDERLPNLNQEEYAIVFKKISTRYSTEDLKNVINDVIAQIQPEANKLRQFEENSLSKRNFTNSTNNKTQIINSPSSSNPPVPKSEINPFAELWQPIITLIGLIIIALILWLIKEIRGREKKINPSPNSNNSSSTSNNSQPVLTQENRKELHEALMDAFPKIESLKQMLSLQLDENLATLVDSNGNLKQTVFELIEVMKSQGRLELLVRAAHKENPGNQKLKTITEKMFDNRRK
jgi:Effector-associated domain 1/Bacterial extracellular solute-binding proteins, family 3